MCEYPHKLVFYMYTLIHCSLYMYALIKIKSCMYALINLLLAQIPL